MLLKCKTNPYQGQLYLILYSVNVRTVLVFTNKLNNYGLEQKKFGQVLNLPSIKEYMRESRSISTFTTLMRHYNCNFVLNPAV